MAVSRMAADQPAAMNGASEEPNSNGGGQGCGQARKANLYVLTDSRIDGPLLLLERPRPARLCNR